MDPTPGGLESVRLKASCLGAERNIIYFFPKQRKRAHDYLHVSMDYYMTVLFFSSCEVLGALHSQLRLLSSPWIPAFLYTTWTQDSQTSL